MSIRDVDGSDKTKAAGRVVIESVDEDSPASKAGLKTGDIVTEFDGERVRSVRQFTRLVSETPEGRTVATVVMRDGQRVTVNVTPEARGTRSACSGVIAEPLEQLYRARDDPDSGTACGSTASAGGATSRAIAGPFERDFFSGGNQLGITTRLPGAATRRALRHQGRRTGGIGHHRFSRGEGGSQGR